MRVCKCWGKCFKIRIEAAGNLYPYFQWISNMQFFVNNCFLLCILPYLIGSHFWQLFPGRLYTGIVTIICWIFSNYSHIQRFRKWPVALPIAIGTWLKRFLLRLQGALIRSTMPSQQTKASSTGLWRVKPSLNLWFTLYIRQSNRFWIFWIEGWRCDS